MSSENRLFELRTYTPVEGKRDALLERLRDTSSRLFAKHGMTNVGYWIETDRNGELTERIIYLLAHESLDAAKASWGAFVKDPEWVELKAHGEHVTANAESVLLSPTEFSALR